MFYRSLLPAVVLLALTIGRLSTVAAENGYLPTTGPAPLRFIAPRPTRAMPPSMLSLTQTNRNAIRPVTGTTANETNRMPGVMTAPRVVSTAPAIRVEAPAGATNGVSSLMSMSSNFDPVDSSPTSTAPTSQAPPTLQGIMPQPQLFLQYFTPEYIPGSNGYGVVVPVGFIPPQPRSAGSSATYQVVDSDKK